MFLQICNEKECFGLISWGKEGGGGEHIDIESSESPGPKVSKL